MVRKRRVDKINKSDINEFYTLLKTNYYKLVVEVLKSDFLTTGLIIKEFEEKNSFYCDVKYCVAVSNGTAALFLASLVLLKEKYNINILGNIK